MHRYHAQTRELSGAFSFFFFFGFSAFFSSLALSFLSIRRNSPLGAVDKDTFRAAVRIPDGFARLLSARAVLLGASAGICIFMRSTDGYGFMFQVYEEGIARKDTRPTVSSGKLSLSSGTMRRELLQRQLSVSGNILVREICFR